MARNNYTGILLITTLLFFGSGNAFAQAPHIAYESPQVYTVGAGITPLLPVNTGGAVPPAAPGQVNQFAGNGNPVSEDGTGAGASFSDPKPIALDNVANIYVGDVGTDKVRKITPAGVVTTLALPGIIQQGIGGIVFDKAGNMYLSYFQSNQIIKVTPSGFSSVFAGSGVGGSAGGIGIQAMLYSPRGMAFDKEGNMYVADYLTSTIRKITPSAVVTIFAGTGVQGSNNGAANQATFKFPLSVCVDANDNVFVTDAGNSVIRKITPAGTVSTFAGGASGTNVDGQGMAASFSDPNGITIDATGNLYIADGFANLIRKITPAGYVSTIAGGGSSGAANGTGTNATFNGVASLVYNGAGKLYVADSYNNLIRAISLTGYEIDKPLPPGLLFDATTGIISGTPTTISPAADYTVTAYNIAGSSSTIVNIKVEESELISFPPIPAKTVCDADFDAGATAGLPVTYASSNTGIATILNGSVHITGAGSADITAFAGTSQKHQTLTVAAALQPSVTITADAAQNCAGDAANYTATTVNGGTTPKLEWYVNGNNSGQTGANFVSSSLVNNDKITCVLTSSAICVTQASVTSSPLVYTVFTPPVPAVTITASVTGPFCAGTEVVFTAAPKISDDMPDYEWQVNGIIKGSNSPVFSSTALNNGDIVQCVLTSKIKCLVMPAVFSNEITIALSPVNICKVIIPNTFTPNGDGINDLWNITALNLFPGCTIKVFTRYGSLIFNSVNYPKPWDGTRNGSALQPGTYYYVIDLKDHKKPLSGTITLIK